jgi:pimeloyl-ACP methyl ester carboxylesterase
MIKKLLGVGAVGASAVIAASVVLYSMQERLIYLPNHPSAENRSPDNNPSGYRHPMERNLPYEDVWPKTRDNVTLHGWFLKQQDPSSPTVLFFQANAGNIGMRMDYIEQLYKVCRLNVFILSYRGYGKSKGSPNEQGLMLDAEAGLSHLFTALNVDKDKVFLFGRSLGGAVAIYSAAELAHSFRIRGVIKENTFTSMGKVVDHVIPGISLIRKAMLRNNWPSIERIGKIKAPILMVSGGRDELIPPSHMRELREKAKLAEFVEWKLVPDGSHNDTWEAAGASYTNWIQDFINKVLRPAL